MKKTRKGSGLFRKYFLITISIILASFVFLGGALLLFVSKLWMDEKSELLTENTISVANNTSDVLKSDYLGESGRGSVIVICNTLHQISNAIGADVFITDTNGQVVYCKEMNVEYSHCWTKADVDNFFDLEGIEGIWK